MNLKNPVSLMNIDGKEIEAVVLPIGPVNLVFARTEKGLVSCGAVDPNALEKFGLAAARVRPSGASVSNLDDLLNGIVREANPTAQALGIAEGMSGREALSRL